ncbi:MAG: phage major tail protein, TP901-1 family [Fastidiosipila sp.]|nr:phage major tail protein, TP901-1 family [Fastidiosipila sp.]
MSTIKAVNKLFLFRIEGEAGDAWKVAYQTDASTSESRSYDSNETKDGTVKAAGAYEASHSLTSYLKAEDTYISKLKGLVRNADSRLEVWGIDRTDINSEEPAAVLPGEYSVDVVTSVSESAGADGNVEVSIDTEVENGIISGEVEVSAALKALLVRVSDEFEFVQPTTAG